MSSVSIHIYRQRGRPIRMEQKLRLSIFRINQAFQDGTILAHLDPKCQTILENDASKFVTVVILSQYDDSGTPRPIAFMQKKLPAERN